MNRSYRFVVPRNTLREIFRYSSLLNCLALLPLAASCNRPAWEVAKFEREQKIDKKLCLIQKREASRPERLERMEARIDKLRCYHAEHLESTRKLVHREWESDKTRWCEQCEKRREFARRQWCGNPEKIPATWAKMVY